MKFENVPAVGRVTITSPSIWQPLERLNEGKKYSDQIKPFNFLLSCHVSPFGHPVGVDPTRFHLIAPYETNSKKWRHQKWIDQYTGNEYWISTSGDYSSRHTARVKTFAEVISEYEFHPESKCADSSGKCATRQTAGLLQRRHIRIDRIQYIGKESNSLEEVNSGLIHSADNVYTEYEDQRRDEWEVKIRPALKQISLSVLSKETGLSRRMIINARKGTVRPHRSNQLTLISVLRRHGLIG